MSAIRVFIGTEPKTEIARKVLEHSIRRRTAAEVVFRPMIGQEWEYSLEGIKVGTGFSLRRWMIPAACDFSGKAIYLDADQIVLGDIADLWAYLPDDAPETIACSYQQDKYSPKVPVPQTSVMVMDCEKAQKFQEFNLVTLLRLLRQDNKRYGGLMHANWLTPPAKQIPKFWNHLNEHNEKTKLLHYTKEPEQPWYMPTHPLAHLWQAELEVAIADRIVDKVEFKAALNDWGQQTDWRKTNGLHPHYNKYLPSFPSSGAR